MDESLTVSEVLPSSIVGEVPHQYLGHNMFLPDYARHQFRSAPNRNQAILLE
jgi:hypothetical protein